MSNPDFESYKAYSEAYEVVRTVHLVCHDRKTYERAAAAFLEDRRRDDRRAGEVEVVAVEDSGT